MGASPGARRDCRQARSESAGHGGGDYYTAREFVRAIQTGTPPAMDVYDALGWTAAGLLSQQSIVGGGVPVAVPDYRHAT